MRFLTIILVLSPLLIFSQEKSKILTSDIQNFWEAYDNLSNALTKEDSVNTVQRDYIDRASPAFRKFIRLRNLNASEYVNIIALYPRFWNSIRPLTENIIYREEEIQELLNNFSTHLPDFKRPDICFAIGNMRTGGTTSKNLILIGTEISAADSTVDKSELKTWQKNVIGNTGNIVSMVAHETVHTQQSGFRVLEFFSLVKHKKLRLLNMAIVEGSADFITSHFLDLNINRKIHQYGAIHECDILKSFKESIALNPFDYSKWLYNGLTAKDAPADLGYYVGYKITEGFYANTENKKSSLKTILRRGQYKRVYKNSGYADKTCN